MSAVMVVKVNFMLVGSIGVVVFVSVSGETFVVMPRRRNNKQYAVTDSVQ